MKKKAEDMTKNWAKTNWQTTENRTDTATDCTTTHTILHIHAFSSVNIRIARRYNNVLRIISATHTKTGGEQIKPRHDNSKNPEEEEEEVNKKHNTRQQSRS